MKGIYSIEIGEQFKSVVQMLEDDYTNAAIEKI